MAFMFYDGEQPWRVIREYPDGSYDDTNEPRPCWRITLDPRDVDGIADVFEDEPGHFELWSEGNMLEPSSPSEALQWIDAALGVSALVTALIHPRG